jgi:aminopeptidase N
VVIALGQMEQTKAIRLLRRIAHRTPDGRVRRMAEEAIQTVQSAIGSDQTLKTIHSELEELKKTNQDLKSRLEELEAKTK